MNRVPVTCLWENRYSQNEKTIEAIHRVTRRHLEFCRIDICRVFPRAIPVAREYGQKSLRSFRNDLIFF